MQPTSAFSATFKFSDTHEQKKMKAKGEIKGSLSSPKTQDTLNLGALNVSQIRETKCLIKVTKSSKRGVAAIRPDHERHIREYVGQRATTCEQKS